MQSLMTKEARMSNMKKFWMFVGAMNGLFLGLNGLSILTNVPVVVTPTAAWIFVVSGVIGCFAGLMSTVTN